jgi:filamentous hemagglutinin family protein
MRNTLKVLTILAATVGLMAPAMADINLNGATSGQVFEGNGLGSNYGAYVNNARNATITSDGTRADINATARFSHIDWRTLNVGKGQTLNYNFVNGSGVSLNTVQNGMSKFAGALTSNGGHVIISNANGMMFVDGASVTMPTGALTLTTHTFSEAATNQFLQNGALNSTNAPRGSAVVIEGGDTAETRVNMNLGQELNIVAPYIALKNADLFGGGNIRLVASTCDKAFKTQQQDALTPQANNLYAFHTGHFDNNGSEGELLAVVNVTIRTNRGAATIRLDGKGVHDANGVYVKAGGDKGQGYVTDAKEADKVIEDIVEDKIINVDKEEERKAEEKRLEEERKKEEERLAEEKRLEDERLAEEKRLEEERKAEEKRLEDERLAKEAEERRLAEEEARRLAELNGTVINEETLAMGAIEAELERNKIASDLDTSFRQIFTPRGFAASDDEIQEVKRDMASKTFSKGSKTTITQSFKAY